MQKIRTFINSHLTGKKVILLFVLTNLVYAIMLIITIPKTMKYSNGMKLLDMMPFGYNSEYIITLFESLGESGRQAYLKTQLPIDMIYPLLFGISYCLLIGYFLKKLNKLNSVYFYLCILPIIAGIADYLENIGIITMLNSYPNLSLRSMQLTSAFTFVKGISTTIFFVSLIITLFFWGVKRIKMKSTIK